MEVEEVGLESLPEEVIEVIVQQMSLGKESEYLKNKTLLSFCNRKWREKFLLWVQNEKVVAPYLLAIAETIPPEDLTNWSSDLWHFKRLNKQTLILGSFHQSYANILGMGDWKPDLSQMALTAYSSPFRLKGYATSIYKEKHAFILKNMHQLSLTERIQYIFDLAEFSSATREVDNAIARDIGLQTQLSYTYAYIKPERKADRNLFIMTKSGKKKIYLNGLRSVYDNRVISEGGELYDISCKQRKERKDFSEARHLLLRGGAMITHLSQSLTKCQPVIGRLRQLKSHLSKRSRLSKKLC